LQNLKFWISIDPKQKSIFETTRPEKSIA